MTGRMATLIVQRDFDKSGSDFSSNLFGTGAFEFESVEVGVSDRVWLRTNGNWRGGEAYFDAIE